MDAEDRERIESAAEVHALFNALQHDGSAQVGTVVGGLMADHPSFREYGDAMAGIVAPVVEAVNELDREDQRERLERLAPERLEDLEASTDDEEDLPPLSDAGAYDEIRLRLAPNPNAPYHLGHARMPAVIGTYRDRYDGWMLCRFDDTDPETKRPDLAAYEAILEDVRYLGFEPDDVIRASDRVETYYEHARELIDAGGAYTCSCRADAFSERKAAGEACPHRDKPRDVVAEEFEAMVEGEFSAGDMVLRVRTDLAADNPAERDWVAFRMVDRPHPRDVAAGYRCWPMLDFQSAIDDHLTGITHIIRGIDLQDSARRQGYLYDYFGWTYPEVVHWGRVEVDEYDVPLSASTITELIDAGELAGWDDPAAPTVASLRRRGIRGAAITDAMVELGTSTSNVELSMSWVYSRNRELIDAAADRYFLVRDGRRLPLDGAPDAAEVPRHPEDDARGVRRLPVGDAVCVEPGDIPAAGERCWLKGLGPFRFDGEALVATDDDIEVVRAGAVPVVHWVPADEARSVRLRRPEGTETGLAETEVADLDSDTVVQFERVGFARIDAQSSAETVAYFAHR